METATRNLDIVTRLKGSEEVKRGFEQMSDSADKMSSTAESRLVPAIEDAIDASRELSVFLPLLKTNFLAIGSSLLVSGGIIAGVVELVKWFNTLRNTAEDNQLSMVNWANQMIKNKSVTRELKEETDNLVKSLREMTNEELKQLKIETENLRQSQYFGKNITFWGNAGERATTLKYADDLIKQLENTAEARKKAEETRPSMSYYDRLKQQEEGLLLILQNTIANTKEQTKAKKDLLAVQKLLSTYEVKQPKEGQFYDKKTVQYLTALNDAFVEYSNNYYTYGEKIANTLNNMGIGKGMTFGAGGQLSGLLSRGVDTSEFNISRRELEKRYDLEINLIRDTANVFRSEFGSAWEDVFGEANSLFEKLIASWAQTMFEKLSGKALGGLLSLIPGGSIIGDLLGFSKAVSVANNYNSKLRME